MQIHTPESITPIVDRQLKPSERGSSITVPALSTSPRKLSKISALVHLLHIIAIGSSLLHIYYILALQELFTRYYQPFTAHNHYRKLV
jgi:hypothetical protein